MTTSAIFDRVRIIPRPDDFLDRNVGSSGEVFYDQQADTLRLYSGKLTGGTTVVTDLNIQEKLSISGISVVTYAVTIAPAQGGDSGYKYIIDGTYKPELNLVVGYTYIFDQSDQTNLYYPNPDGGIINQHPLNFSADNANGALGGGTSYTTNVLYKINDDVVTQAEYWSKFPGATQRSVQITVTSSTPTTLYYWCQQHLNMGNSITSSNPGSGSSGASISVSDTAPSSPSSGAIWFNSSSGILYVYYTDPDGSQWVQPSAGNVSNDYNNLTNKPTLDTLSNAGTVDFGTNKILYSNNYTDLASLPSASTYHGMFAHVHGTGKAYYAHAGAWKELANAEDAGGIVEGSNYRINIVADDSSVIVDSSTGKVPWTAIDGTPTTVTGYGITDAAGGNFTFVGSTLDTADSSGITITPAVTMSSDLNVENDIRASNSIYAGEFVNTGAGAPEIDSATTLTLKAPDGVQVQSGAFRLASFNNAGRDALTPVNGDMIYNTQDNKIQAYINGNWRRIDDSAIV
tara:strand:+ start:3110 stop:4654 length:1545 start_codon:yes stop_codon:yes gene_type:complete